MIRSGSALGTGLGFRGKFQGLDRELTGRPSGTQFKVGFPKSAARQGRRKPGPLSPLQAAVKM